MTKHARLTPKTEASLKRIAKRISREGGIAHMAALDIAARQAGSTDYRAFQKAIRSSDAAPASYQYPIYGRWSEWPDPAGNPISKGEVEATVSLPRPFREIFPRSGDWKSDRTMGRHIGQGAFSVSASSRRSAFEWTLRTARALQFMAATGLRNSRWPHNGPWVKLAGDGYGSFAGVPGQDHLCAFRDPETRQILIISESYRTTECLAEARKDWKKAELFDIRPLTWGSLYIAGVSVRSELISLKGYGVDLDRIEAQLAASTPALTRDDIEVRVTAGTPSPDCHWPDEIANT
ncbi:hypothetical protein KUV57_13625 [Epibacterium sp. DP7N7-1]|nr:hypothetical protein [Epibacterium sp. DP7N7-1]